MRPDEGVGILDAVRNACRSVAERPRWVAIDHDRLGSYTVGSAAPPTNGPTADREAVAALTIQLDAINFGSGWHPVLHKRPAMSGSRAIAAAYREWAAGHGVPHADRLAELSAADCAALLGQDAAGEVGALMALFARSLNDLGRFVDTQFGGSFLGLVEEAQGSAARLVDLLVEMPLYRDVVEYRGLTVPLLKRAQITVNDLARELRNTPPARFDDLDDLTMFADNLVPHVLRLDGLMRFDPDLAARIDAGQLLAYGSEEEVEIRAVAVDAVERLAAASGRPARVIDEILWKRGAGARYKAVPRHRCRTTAY